MIERYAIAKEGESELDHEFNYYEEALEAAELRADQCRGERWQIICRKYEYADSELIHTVEYEPEND